MRAPSGLSKDARRRGSLRRVTGDRLRGLELGTAASPARVETLALAFALALALALALTLALAITQQPQPQPQPQQQPQPQPQ